MSSEASSNTSDNKKASKTQSAADGGIEPKTEDVQPFVVNGVEVTEEEYNAALPKAGYTASRMPANFRPPLSTK